MFASFALAGFDCTVSHNARGRALNSRIATQHHLRIAEDYAMLRRIGITAVRDGIAWPEIQVGRRRFDWRALDRVSEAGRQEGIEIIYDLCHFGFPAHLDVFSEDFVQEFASFCYAATRRIAGQADGQIFITPFNEPSYYAWAAGHAALFPPYCRDRGFDLKVQCVRALLAGVEAIWAAEPSVRIVNVDPVCRAVAPPNAAALIDDVTHFNEVAVFECWDMIAGRLLPELGGSPRHLGTMGINYYWTNQWEFGQESVPLDRDDARRLRLRDLVEQVWRRYGVDLLISETGQVGEYRAAWVQEMASEAAAILSLGIPLQGVCLYPILGMPAWHDPDSWVSMGLWDVGEGGERVVNAPMLTALPDLQKLRGPAIQPFSKGEDHDSNGRQHSAT